MAVPAHPPQDAPDLGLLFKQHAPEIRCVLMNRMGDEHAVDDVLQATFLQLNQHRDRIDLRSVRAWLFRVAINMANMQGRKQKMDAKVWKRMVQEGEFLSESPESIVLRKERIDEMRLLLESLPENQQELIKLKFYQGLTFAKIAAQTETPLGTVLSRMRSALKSLELLGNQRQLRERS